MASLTDEELDMGVVGKAGESLGEFIEAVEIGGDVGDLLGPRVKGGRACKMEQPSLSVEFVLRDADPGIAGGVESAQEMTTACICGLNQGLSLLLLLLLPGGLLLLNHGGSAGKLSPLLGFVRVP